jgi:hypothetical protein
VEGRGTLYRDTAKRLTEEQLRRVASRSTEVIARHWGEHFPMWIGCGFQKSGTVWLCKLMSAYLGVPYPQNYALPIAMRSVVHAHWSYDPRLPKTAYIHRDGRDVMVSLYFHQVRSMTEARHPHSATKLRRRFTELFGTTYDLDDVRGNLARFIDAEFREPSFMSRTWSEHVDDWMAVPRENVFAVSYEALKADTESALSDLMTRVEGAPADAELVRYAARRNDFALVSGRAPGAEDRTADLRKGIVGDWRNFFTREAAEIFEAAAGPTLRHLGYEADSSWVQSLD